MDGPVNLELYLTAEFPLHHDVIQAQCSINVFLCHHSGLDCLMNGTYEKNCLDITTELNLFQNKLMNDDEKNLRHSICFHPQLA